MRIESIQIRSIKSIENLFFSPNSQHTVLTGSNNSGKSTLLQCLRVLHYFIGEPWPFSGSNLDVVTDKMAEVIPEIVLNVMFDPQDLLQLDARYHSEKPIHYVFTFQLPQQSNFRIVPYIIEEDTGSSPKKPIWFMRSTTSFIANVEKGGSIEVQIHNDSDIIQHTNRAMAGETRLISLDPLRFLAKKMFFYDPFRSISESVSLAGPKTLEASGASLARQLATWRLDSDDRLDRYCALVESLCPGLGVLVTPRDTNAYTYLGFRKNNTTISVTAMGTGVQQLLVLAYQLIATEAHILCLEEPESHLHPTAQRALFRAIKDASIFSQVFLTTHSPLFVDRVKYANNWIIERDNDRTRIKQLPISDPFRPIRDVLGVSLGDTLFAGDAILVVEGPTEQIALPLLTDKARSAEKPFIDFDRVKVINAGGIGNVQSILRVLKSYGVPIFVLLDNSNNTRQTVKSIVKSGLVEERFITIIKRPGADVLQNRKAEIEDVLPFELYISAINDRYQVTINPDQFKAAEDVIMEERNRLIMPHTPDVVKLLLSQKGIIEHGDDYDKVGVAIRTIEQMSPTDIPEFFGELAEKITNLLEQNL